MEYTDQTSGAIRLYLAKGGFDIGQFAILREATLVYEGITIRFGILGESHFIEFSRNGEILSEICACVEAAQVDRTRLIAHDFLPNLHAIPVTTNFHNHSYAFTFTYADWHHGEAMLQALRESGGAEHVHTLTYTFPSHDDIPHEAVTELYLTTNDTITLKTVHTYPNEHMMVFTESTLVPKEKHTHERA